MDGVGDGGIEDEEHPPALLSKLPCRSSLGCSGSETRNRA